MLQPATALIPEIPEVQSFLKSLSVCAQTQVLLPASESSAKGGGGSAVPALGWGINAGGFTEGSSLCWSGTASPKGTIPPQSVQCGIRDGSDTQQHGHRDTKAPGCQQQLCM